MSGFFAVLAAGVACCIAMLVLADGAARPLGEDFGLTPWYVYVTLVAGTLVLAFLSWFAGWQAEWQEPAALPPNPEEPEEDTGWLPGLFGQTEAVSHDDK
ncbi:MAG: hypothetical protein WCW25_01570 [Patescibacteria group bacterium]